MPSSGGGVDAAAAAAAAFATRSSCVSTSTPCARGNAIDFSASKGSSSWDAAGQSRRWVRPASWWLRPLIDGVTEEEDPAAARAFRQAVREVEPCRGDRGRPSPSASRSQPHRAGGYGRQHEEVLCLCCLTFVERHRGARSRCSCAREVVRCTSTPLLTFHA